MHYCVTLLRKIAYICLYITTTNAKLMILAPHTIAVKEQLLMVERLVGFLEGQELYLETSDADDHVVESFELLPCINGVWRVDIIAEVSTHNDEPYDQSAYVEVLNEEGHLVTFLKSQQDQLNETATLNITIQ